MNFGATISGLSNYPKLQICDYHPYLRVSGVSTEFGPYRAVRNFVEYLAYISTKIDAILSRKWKLILTLNLIG